MVNLIDELDGLDDAHSTLVSLVESGNTPAVLATLASVMGRIPELEGSRYDAAYWQTVIFNLNTTADRLQRDALSEEEFDALSEQASAIREIYDDGEIY